MKRKIRELYNQGYFTYEIALMLNVSEAYVVSVVHPEY